jgi:hypothetical protein
MQSSSKTTHSLINQATWTETEVCRRPARDSCHQASKQYRMLVVGACAVTSDGRTERAAFGPVLGCRIAMHASWSCGIQSQHRRARTCRRRRRRCRSSAGAAAARAAARMRAFLLRCACLVALARSLALRSCCHS